MHDDSQFCLTPVLDFAWSGAGNACVLRVNLPAEADLSVLRSPAELEPFRRPDRLLWVSGGGCYILNGEWIPLVRRSRSSPSNPDRVTICSGRADSPRELYEPSGVFRELFEEIVLLDEDGAVIVPDLASDELHSGEFGPRQLGEIIAPLLALTGIESTGFIPVPAEFDGDLALDQVEVFRAGEPISRTQCLVHHQPDTGEINLLRVVRLDMGDQDLESLRFFDTECGMSNGARGPLRRDIYLFHIPTGDLFSNSAGWSMRIAPVSVPLTGHASRLLGAIRRVHGA